jgi:hypothetical protein
MQLQTTGDDRGGAGAGTRLYDTWYDIVSSEYSRRLLSFGQDRFPAISGVAKEIGRLLPRDDSNRDKYLAGLWAGDIAHGLLWFPKEAGTATRPAEYRTPSWSWASVDAERFALLWRWRAQRDGRVSDVEVLEGYVEPDGADDTGRVKPGGWLSRAGLWTPRKFGPTSCIVSSRIRIITL